ncbi:MAG: hypothetical protein RI926_1132 [Actinomycetota bacterium]|jgi:S-DNA-T family DNA segregation ATPase FtsK/SpoIIIE
MRLPIFALIAPLVTSIVLWLVTGSAYTLLFAFLGPVMALAQYLDGKFHAKRETLHHAEREEEEELARSQQQQLTAFAERAEMLLKHPSSSHFARPDGVLRPLWAAGAQPEGTGRVIRLGIARQGGMPVQLDITHGIALRGDPVETRSVMRAMAFQLAWMWGSHEITRVALDFTEEPELVVLFSREQSCPPAITALPEDSAVPLGTRYLLKVDRGHATLLDTVDPSAGAIEMSIDLLARAEVSLILPKLLAETTPREDEYQQIPERAPAILATEEEWESARQSLVVNVGRQATHPLLLDLVTAGPHAIVTGMTGSGKTEFLKTWMVALAATYSPDQLSILVIDFKGGAGFSALSSLPHVVGVVTDLNHDEALRAMTSLHAELRFREAHLAQAKVGDISAVENVASLPRLIVVVDEYRAVLDAFPELLGTFVDLAARGRALGIHLILSSQRVGGSMGEALLANCALRVGFRVSQKQDSQSLLGNDAAFHMPHIAGRAVIAGTAMEQREFQAAQLTAEDIERVEQRCEQWLVTNPEWTPRVPWLPPLPTVITAESMPQGLPGVAWLGLADIPQHQVQTWAQYCPELEGNLLVTGPARSGRSTALQLIAEQLNTFVITDAEQAWDYAVEQPEDSLIQALILDDLDAVLEEFDHEHREEFISALARLARQAPKQGRAVILSCSEHVRGVAGLLSLFPSSLTLVSSHKPGRALWNNHEVQLVKKTLDSVSTFSSEKFTFDVDSSYVVVSHRKAQLLKSFGSADFRVNDLSSELSMAGGGEVGMYIGTPDEWMSQPRLLATLRQACTLVLDGCTSADIRGLRLRSGLFPHAGYGKTLVVEPDGSTTRVIL